MKHSCYITSHGQKCVAIGLDNTNVSMGKRNYIKSRVQKEVGLCNIVGCPCHLINSTACRGSEALDAVATFNVEVFGIDIRGGSRILGKGGSDKYIQNWGRVREGRAPSRDSKGV